MNNPFTICAFYTPNYREIFNNHLKISLDRLKLENYVKELPDLGDWRRNTLHKSRFARECLNNVKNNVVIVDVDASINYYPELFTCIEGCYDIGAHILDHSTWYHNGSDRQELLTGTLYFKNSDNSRLIVEKWIEACNNTNLNDQDVLDQVIHRNHIILYNLPLSYCYIDSLPSGSKPFVVVENPVIQHFQASRIERMKNVRTQ